MRKLASIRRISEIKPIANADAIEVAVVDGWEVVIKKGEYKPGDLAVYLEIDSWVPHEMAPFLSKGQEPREYEGIRGNRLRTVKLRGQVSQGLLLPLEPTCDMIESMLFEGLDVTVPLGIVKYDPPIPACLAGEVEGMFPGFISKTDQERVQNLIQKQGFFDGTWEVTLKLDGSSMTMFVREGEVGVCSRNLWLKDNEANEGNTLVQLARQFDYKNLLPKVAQEVGFDFAVQGEVMGPGVQKNREKLSKATFFVFDVFNISASKYLTPRERDRVVKLLQQQALDIEHVPMLGDVSLTGVELSVGKFLEMADVPSLNHKYAEGIVFKHLDDPSRSFKVISNRFLLKEE